jgi:sigma-B regulation protein RsbU (phosphoserine phosphatase)
MANILPIVQSLLRAESGISTLTRELADRYEETDLLYTIGELLGHARAVEEVGASILREVAVVVGARRAGLRVLDEGSRSLRSIAMVGVSAGLIPPEVSIDAPDDVVVARAFRSHRIETGPQPTWVPGEVLAVPIMYAASGQIPRVVGILALADRAGGGSFTREETKLVAAIANQIGAALENARLVERVREQQRLGRELELAHDLQIKLMPTAAVLQGEADVSVRSVPAESRGGDFYTFSRLGRGRIGVMLGDVSSHGFSAALIAAQVMAAAGIHANADTPPDEALTLLRDSLGDELASTEMYFTLFYGVLDPMAGHLVYSNAGHPHAFRIPRFGPAERLEPTAPPLGLADSAFGRAVVPWRFSQDLLVLFTDGLTDQAGPLGVRYGEERLIARLEAGRDRHPDDLQAWVLDDLTAFGGTPHDDTTLLIFRM